MHEYEPNSPDGDGGRQRCDGVPRHRQSAGERDAARHRTHQQGRGTDPVGGSLTTQQATTPEG